MLSAVVKQHNIEIHTMMRAKFTDNCLELPPLMSTGLPSFLWHTPLHLYAESIFLMSEQRSTREVVFTGVYSCSNKHATMRAVL